MWPKVQPFTFILPPSKRQDVMVNAENPSWAVAEEEGCGNHADSAKKEFDVRGTRLQLLDLASLDDHTCVRASIHSFIHPSIHLSVRPSGCASICCLLPTYLPVLLELVLTD